ncbi:hypothetical protein [Noviluteimonas gilva]|uniref:Transmembrane protein n=1 Tax=Noviluteimonas gilva TaxID=2682097 RepID=A0A7C9HNT9_9GAMM|nr:hypothetical protein [Lysobacter gilvus]MUV15276.1 hypothetical protein [Lysobacter gilvus]
MLEGSSVSPMTKRWMLKFAIAAGLGVAALGLFRFQVGFTLAHHTRERILVFSPYWFEALGTRIWLAWCAYVVLLASIAVLVPVEWRERAWRRGLNSVVAALLSIGSLLLAMHLWGLKARSLGEIGWAAAALALAAYVARVDQFKWLGGKA